MLKGPNEKFDIVKVRDSGYSRQRISTVYAGYGTGFSSRSELSLPDGSMDKNVIIFGVDMSSSVHIDDNKIDILILGFGSPQGLDDTSLTADAK